jgi:hypothetical protein
VPVTENLMRIVLKLAVLLLLVVSGQVAFDVIAATSSYPGFKTMNAATYTQEADAAYEVETRLAQCNPASRWVASQIFGFERSGA